jgi:hypothetical protein
MLLSCFNNIAVFVALETTTLHHEVYNCRTNNIGVESLIQAVEC